MLVDGKTISESSTNEVQCDVPSNVPEFEEEDDDTEPKERGSDAVERRIEKCMADLRDQGLVDVNDEKVYEAKKVRTPLCFFDCLVPY